MFKQGSIQRYVTVLNIIPSNEDCRLNGFRGLAHSEERANPITRGDSSPTEVEPEIEKRLVLAGIGVRRALKVIRLLL